MANEFHYHASADIVANQNPTYMTPEEIKSYNTYSLVNDGLDPVKRAYKRMVDNGVWESHQILGSRWAIGCVALEVTQRCNLDCTLCYLSESSEAVKDIPLDEIYRRIELIHKHYGSNTDVQVTGGDPTLRQKDELLNIVRKIKSLGMRPTLMTNGIKASRELLTELRDAGLVDVAFHVDTTQERKGYATEVDLNKIRMDYVERARGLGISVLFNTTVHKDNFNEIPEVIKFFKKNADVINFVSFQLQADTGRGVLRERDNIISSETVINQIRKGTGENLRFDVPLIGHRDCNHYATSLIVNENCYDAFYDADYIRDMVRVTKDILAVRDNQNAFAQKVVKTVMSDLKNWIPSFRYAGKLVWRMKWDLLKAKGNIRKQSYFIHNFMGADQLEQCRIDTCSFMVITHAGPVSMCMHNAKRDDFILKPFKAQESDQYWNPLTGKLQSSEDFFKEEGQLKSHQIKGTLKQKTNANVATPETAR